MRRYKMIAIAVQSVVMPHAAGVSAGAPGPLAAAHLAMIAEARVRGKKVRRPLRKVMRGYYLLDEFGRSPDCRIRLRADERQSE